MSCGTWMTEENMKSWKTLWSWYIRNRICVNWRVRCIFIDFLHNVLISFKSFDKISDISCCLEFGCGAVLWSFFEIYPSVAQIAYSWLPDESIDWWLIFQWIHAQIKCYKPTKLLTYLQILFNNLVLNFIVWCLMMFWWYYFFTYLSEFFSQFKGVSSMLPRSKNEESCKWSNKFLYIPIV